MSEKKQESFTVTDRRLFTPEGELRREVSEEEVSTSKPETATEAKPTASVAEPPAADRSVLDSDMPPSPTADEQKEQADAYHKSARELDARVELSGHSAKEMEMTFERFMASLYMTAMLQLGLMQEEKGQPRIDLLGARQTVDTLSLLAEKTKGNLTSKEENFLQNCLYELRMAYVEVTNALARPPQAAATNPAKR
ncbi:MAG: DUF1844 domain-containing protein [Terriglobales bacterium]